MYVQRANAGNVDWERRRWRSVAEVVGGVRQAVQARESRDGRGSGECEGLGLVKIDQSTVKYPGPN